MCVHVEAKLRNKITTNYDKSAWVFQPFKVGALPHEKVDSSCFRHDRVYVPKPRAEMASSSKALKESDLLRLFKAFKGFYIIITILTPV